MIRAAYGFKPQTEGRAGRHRQEASGFAVSAATAGPIHTPRFVMLDQAVEIFCRRQASVNVDRDGRVAYAQRRTVVCLFVCEAELPLQGLRVVRGRKTQAVFVAADV